VNSAARRLPGHEGLWFFLSADLVLFLLLFGSYSSERSAHALAFAQAKHLLMPNLAALNTLYLLTGSWLAAAAVHAVKRQRVKQAGTCIAGAVVFGVAFIATKMAEYAFVVREGVVLGDGGFFMYYFVITGVHLFHVIGGTGLLLVVWWRLRHETGSATDPLLTQSGASFWHIVDILWLIIFPMFYLLP
jgi:nitric oxide reductase NorE protein